MDVFKLLASGARFTDKRNKEIKNLFQGKAPAPVVAKEKVTDSDDESEVKKDRGFDFSREDEVNGFRNRLRIRVKGSSVVNPCPTFQEMKIDGTLKTSLLRNIEASKWKEPTPIQMQSIPVLLANRDILAAAPTGSGKTASYVIPTLSKLSKSSSKSGSGVRALLLSPTKELADQIFREVQRLSEGRKIKSCVLKKKLMKMAEDHGRKVFQKYDLLIATPLRLLTLVRSNSIDLSQVEIVVLDEADRLLDLQSSPRERNQQPPSDEEDEEEDDDDEDDEANPDKEPSQRERSAFLSQVDEILAQCPATGVQRALFSATLGSFVKELASTFLRDPVEVTIGAENTGASTIKQRLVFVGREDGKLLAMRQLIQEGLKPPVLVFMQSIDRAKDLFKELIYDGINVDVMHAGRSAHQREDIMRRFRIGDIWVLICTDLMARGIDFQGVQMVVNYDLPVSAVSYIHRIGRTGRAGRTGEAVTFFTEEDMPRIRPIANVIKLSGCEVPDWMLQIKAMSTKHKKQLRRSAPKRRRIGIGSLTVTEGNRFNNDDEEEGGDDAFQPQYHGSDAAGDDGGDWETADAFNDADDGDDDDGSNNFGNDGGDAYELPDRANDNDNDDQEEGKQSGKKRRRQSKQTGLTSDTKKKGKLTKKKQQLRK